MDGRFLAQKRLLKMPLVRGERAAVRPEDGLQVFEGLVQRLGLSRSGRWLLPAEPTSHRREPTPQPSDDAVDRLQRKRQAQTFRGGFERGATAQPNQ